MNYFENAEVVDIDSLFDDIDVIAQIKIDLVVPEAESEEIFTPFALAKAYEMQQRDFNTTTYFEMKFLPYGGFKTFKVGHWNGTKDLTGGHPVGKLTAGSRAKVVSCGISYVLEVVAVNIAAGTVEFKDDFFVPYVVFDILGGDVEKKKIYDTLQELHTQWSKEGTFLKEVFLKKLGHGGELTDSDPLGYTHGAVGSGKTYKMSLDVLRHSTEGLVQIVSSQNNDALTDAGKEIEARGLRVVQFTNRDTPYAMSNVFRDNKLYNDWMFWRLKDPETRVEMMAKRNATAQFSQFIKRFVILVTPSKATSIRKALGFKFSEVSIYVDEGGMMRFIDFCALLLFQSKRIWVYGDHAQNEPFDDLKQQRNIKDIYHYDLARFAHNVGNDSVAEWFMSMRVPYLFIEHIRRCPAEDSKMLSSFFYKSADSLDYSESWLKGKTPPVLFKVTASTCVPPPLLNYPYMSSVSKEKESSRMNKFMSWFAKYTAYVSSTNAVNRVYALAVISPYNHLKESLQFLWEKYYKDVFGTIWKPTFVTSTSVQGSTHDYTLFYCSYTPGKFVTDRKLLVSWSRHRVGLVIAPYNINGIVTSGCLVNLHLLGIITLSANYVLYDQNDIRSRTRRRQVLLTFKVLDKERLRRFFTTKTFDFYLDYGAFPFYTDAERKNTMRGRLVDDAIIAAYENDPSVHINVKGEGQYKHVLLKLSSQQYLIDEPPGMGYSLCTDGNWRRDVKHSVLLNWLPSVPLGKPLSKGYLVFDTAAVKSKSKKLDAAVAKTLSKKNVTPLFTESDAELVASQANVSIDRAKFVLNQEFGDIINSIICLTNLN